jgi:preprotein translocase subunit YajC
MFLTPVLAQAAAGGGGNLQDMLIQFAPFALIAVLFYFMLIRPQQQRAKEHRTAIGGAR